MVESVYRIMGIIVSCFGAILILQPIGLFLIWFGEVNYPINPPTVYISPYGFSVMFLLFLYGIAVLYSGLHLLKKSTIANPFVTKDGGPIHSAKPWKRDSESGLFLTSCGLIVSINQESKATAHVGYRLVSSKHATHRACVEQEGRLVLEGFSKHRSW